MRLTEDMIVTRSKTFDLNSVRELNMCGYSLTDISAVTKLPNIQVLALSVNNISNLSPFRACTGLRELYLRRNNIQNIEQILYLQKLPHLQKLWLIENPICIQLGPTYRTVILSLLPNVKVLDNIPVSREEAAQARFLNTPYDQSNFTEHSEPINKLALPAPNDVVSTEVAAQDPSNVLTAIFTLVKELDVNGLETLHSQIGSRINQFYSERR